MFIAAAIGFSAACVMSLVLTAIIRKVALKIGLIDLPDAHRKLHEHPVPLGGGVAIFLATAAVLAVVLVVPNPWGLHLHQDWWDVLAFLLAGVVIVGVGLVDDRWGLRGRQKLLGQVAAASILMAGGLLIRRIELFGTDIELGLLTIPFTMFWLVGAINALNLLDGIDGLATTLGIILGGTLGVLAAITGHPAVAMVAVVFTGSLLGFLRFNFPPAKIFLGDSGSMLIGLMVGALAIRGSLRGPGTVLLAAPLAVWTIPIFDSAVAILRRKLTGRSVYTTDRGHLHHRLLEKVGSNRKVLAFIAACCAITCAAALASVLFDNDLIALVSCAAIVTMFVVTGIFGRGELLLLLGRLRRTGLSLARHSPVKLGRIRQSSVQLQGSQRWDLLWATLTESADEFGLDKISLELNMPAKQEGYSALWERPIQDDLERSWRVELPLVLADQLVGRLTIVGNRNGKSVYEDIERLQDLVEPFEERLLALSQGQGEQKSGEKVPALTGDGDSRGVQGAPNLDSTALAQEHPR